MLGLMQQRPLLISSLITHAARHHGTTEIVSRTAEGPTHRTTYAEAERRARRLVRVLQHLGVQVGVRDGDRVGTLAWNGFRHFEIYYAVSGMGAVCHTINPRLPPDDIAYIVTHAADTVLCADITFAKLIEQVAPRVAESVRAVVMMTDAAHMPEMALPPGMALHCYETLMAEADADYAWPEFDENKAASLCYTSGTTGRPKGVLYSHRSTLLHAYGVNLPDVLGLHATDRIMPVVPMFHVNAWGIPYAAPMTGAALVFPGRYLDGASVHQILNGERVTVSCGVPTVWLGLLQHLRSTGGRLDTVKRLMTGGSACPPLLVEAFGDEYGVRVEHGWGMTEMSPVGTYSAPKPAHQALSAQEERKLRLKQGRVFFGVDMKIVDDAGRDLPWDGKAFGNLMVRGPWVLDSYYGTPPQKAADDEGWFATGDVATIDPEGVMEIVDRTKDVVKSGGEWISSIALENIAVSHPDVAEAAIIAATHPKWQERPLLVVVPREGRTVSPQALIEFMRGRVPDWWLPDGVVSVEEMPHTATGKISKLTLRERYRDWLAQAAGT